MNVRRCVIFDLDGTLVDSHAYTFAAFRHACSPYRDAPSDAQILAAFGPWERVILSGLLASEHVDAAYARLQSYYARHAGELAVHPAVRPLLGDCVEAGVRLGLFTGRGRDSTALVLAALGLERSFEAVVAGDAVLRPAAAAPPALRPKPAPDGVLHILRTLGCAPGEALVVGDSRLDVEAARAAGALPLFATWHPWPVRPPPDGVVCLGHPDDLRRFLVSPAGEARFRVPGEGRPG